jgi:hypothetical protein
MYEYTYSSDALAAQAAAAAANASAAWAAATIPGLAPGSPFNTISTTYKLAQEFQIAYNARYPGPSTPDRKLAVSGWGGLGCGPS